jgi:hypothetical protein
VSTLVESLLRRQDFDGKSPDIETIALADLRKLTLKMLVSKMAIDVWIGLGGAIVAAFLAGIAFNSWISPLEKGASRPAAAINSGTAPSPASSP